jgi:hypothetical protein
MHEAVLRVLSYYDIWAHPLTVQELALFLPIPLRDRGSLETCLREALASGTIRSVDGMYLAAYRPDEVVPWRKNKERRARRLWTMARISMHIIKRFPFVRGVLVSGELSKNVAARGSDIDFFILTAPRRLWLTRSLLVLFKKVFLLNSKKFFCLNYFATTDELEETGKNVYVAAEISHVKPLYNSDLYRRYLNANSWIRDFFPNFEEGGLPSPRVSERRSVIQLFLELALAPLPLDRADTWLQRVWRGVWSRRYAHFGPDGLERAFTSTASISRAYVGDFQEKILREYGNRLAFYGLT